MCINMMKQYGIKKVFYSTASGEIVSQKVADMIPEHISYGATRALENMSGLNQYLIFGITIKPSNIKARTLVYDNG